MLPSRTKALSGLIRRGSLSHGVLSGLIRFFLVLGLFQYKTVVTFGPCKVYIRVKLLVKILVKRLVKILVKSMVKIRVKLLVEILVK